MKKKLIGWFQKLNVLVYSGMDKIRSFKDSRTLNFQLCCLLASHRVFTKERTLFSHYLPNQICPLTILQQYHTIQMHV